jgi:serine/threonine protein kinase
VAVKYVQFAKANDKAKFLQEAKLYQLAAPNPFVASFVTSCATGKQGIIAMELMNGGMLMNSETLESPLYGLDQPLGEVASSVLRKLLIGLEMMHRVKVYHRDIKPENIMVNIPTPGVCGGFMVKYIDFGMACDSIASCDLHCGTKRYMPPEMWYPDLKMDMLMQLGGNPGTKYIKVNERRDVWSLGTTLLFFITRGEWNVETDIGWLRSEKWEGNIVKHQPGADAWPKPLRCLLEKMLVAKLSNRPSALALLPDLC